MDVVIVFSLALIEIRTPQSDEVKLSRGDGPGEQLWFLRVQQGPISSQAGCSTCVPEPGVGSCVSGQ